MGLRAMPLSIYQHVPVELQGPVDVLAWRVLGELGVAGRDVVDTRRCGRRVRGLVVRREVEADDCVDGHGVVRGWVGACDV